MPSIAEIIARAYARGLLPRHAASGLFWRLAPRDERLETATVRARVRFGDGSLRLRLPLKYKQNWTLLFGGFSRTDDAPVLDAFCQRARTARGVIDVGVNVGMYIYHAVGCAPREAEILGVEATPDLVRMVNENLRDNGYANAEVVLAAATAEPGDVTFYLSDDDRVSSIERDHVEKRGTAVASTVRGATLDELVAERGMSPDLVKVDVEGHEVSVLEGASEVLSVHRPTLVIEATPSTAPAVHAMLSDHGYTGRRFEGDRLVPAAEPLVQGAYANFLYEPTPSSP